MTSSSDVNRNIISLSNPINRLLWFFKILMNTVCKKSWLTLYFHDFSFIGDCLIFTVADWPSLISRIKKWVITRVVHAGKWKFKKRLKRSKMTFQRFQPLSKFHFLACTTLAITYYIQSSWFIQYFSKLKCKPKFEIIKLSNSII